MSKALASYPEHIRGAVITRRMKQYDPKGGNGLGTLAAHDYYVRHLGASEPTKKKKESPSDLRRRERRRKVSDEQE